MCQILYRYNAQQWSYTKTKIVCEMGPWTNSDVEVAIDAFFVKNTFVKITLKFVPKDPIDSKENIGTCKGLAEHAGQQLFLIAENINRTVVHGSSSGTDPHFFNLWPSSSMNGSVRRPPVRLSVTPFSLCSHHRIIMKFSMSYYQWQKWCPCKMSRSGVKGQGDEMMHKFDVA